ncbi:MAG: DNA-directed RNA polymerase subunit omega [Microthrixaceae bacterium]
MDHRHDTMIEPEVEELLSRAGSKFSLVTLAARRARQINNYVHQLGRGAGSSIPPQVASNAAKPLSIAFEEIAEDKILPVNAPGMDNPEGVELDEEGHVVHPGDPSAESGDEFADASQPAG